jgi:hypothetical protein
MAPGARAIVSSSSNKFSFSETGLNLIYRHAICHTSRNPPRKRRTYFTLESIGVDNLLEAELVQKFEIQCGSDLLGPNLSGERIGDEERGIFRAVRFGSRFYASFEHFPVELMGKRLSKLLGGFDPGFCRRLVRIRRLAGIHNWNRRLYVRPIGIDDGSDPDQRDGRRERDGEERSAAVSAVSADARCTRDFSPTLRTFVDVAHREILGLEARDGRLLSIRRTISSMNFEVPVVPDLGMPDRWLQNRLHLEICGQGNLLLQSAHPGV